MHDRMTLGDGEPPQSQLRSSHERQPCCFNSDKGNLRWLWPRYDLHELATTSTAAAGVITRALTAQTITTTTAYISVAQEWPYLLLTPSPKPLEQWLR